MKAFLILTMIGLLFLAGYYCGQIPGSPDLYTWVDGRLQDLDKAGKSEFARDVGNAFHKELAALSSSVKPEVEDKQDRPPPGNRDGPSP